MLSLMVLLFIVVTFIFTGAHYGNSRPLTEEEIIVAKSIYQNEIDLNKVRLAFDAVYSKGASKTLGNIIHINTNFLDVKSIEYKFLLIHELGHAWQYQTNGWGYIPKSLIAQGMAWFKTGSRDNAYLWQNRLSEGKEWEELNPEEQAEAIAYYFYYKEFGPQESFEQLQCFIPFLVKTSCQP